MRNLFLSATLAVALLADVAVAQSPPPSLPDAVETALLPAVVFDGQAEPWTLRDRMTRWKVPGVSIAVIDDGRIVWAQGYGVIDAGGTAPVTTETRFQAASISKPVAAAAALAMVDDGQLALDRDVNIDLRRWTLPPSAFTAERPLTLRDLLSHTGGTTVHGFPGYAPGEAIPTLPQILNGDPPANTAAVVSEARPGERWKYSGGGYEIVQQLIEDVSGRPFADVVLDGVLAPARMAVSGYETPAAGDFALGHGSDGQPIAGGWHIYPEQAAAGLWTTPTDLARFGLALAASLRDDPGSVLTSETARTMMTPVMNDYGLGPGVSGDGETLALSHGGSNEGFRAFWIIHPNSEDGVVVMTNGDGGDRLLMEIVRAVSASYGWPDYQPAQAATFDLAGEILEAREGTWSTEWQGERIAFTVKREGGRLAIVTFRGTFLFTPTSSTTMTSGETGVIATFALGDDGRPSLTVFGLPLTKGEPDLSAAE